MKKDLVVSSPDLIMTYNGNSKPNFDKANQITFNPSDLASGDDVDVVNQKILLVFYLANMKIISK